MFNMNTNLEIINIMSLGFDVPFFVRLITENCNSNGYAFSLLDARGVFIFFLLIVVVIVDIESRSDDTHILDADRLLPLKLLVE